MPIIAVVYSIAVSGDFMAMSRFLVPALAFNAILFGWLLKDISSQSSLRKILTTTFGVLVVTIGLLPVWNMHPIPEALRSHFHFRKMFMKNYVSEYVMWTIQKRNAQKWVEKGKLLKTYAKPGDSIVQGAIGAVGYYSGLFIYDRCGIVTHSVASRKTADRPLLMPGHDKMVPYTFFTDKQPTIIWAHEVTRRRLYQVIPQVANSDIADHYVADFMQMSEKHPNGQPMYLVIYRRIKKGIDPKIAWRKVFISLAEIPGW